MSEIWWNNTYIHALGLEENRQRALAKELHSAARKNDTIGVRSILNSNKDDLKFVNMRVEDQTGVLITPLGIASFYGFTEIVKLLVRRAGADPDIKDSEDYTATYRAVIKGNFEVTKVLIEEAHSNINLNNGPLGNTVIMAAIVGKWSEILNYLIPKVEDINAKNNEGFSSLHGATGSGNLKAVKDLVLKGKADVNLKNGPNGFTAALKAASDGTFNIFKFLVEEGNADLTIRDDLYGQDPLYIASFEGRTEIVRYLATRTKVRPDGKTKAGQTPLYAAAFKGFFPVVKILVEQMNADVNSKNTYGYDSMPLGSAAVNGHPRVVRYLLNHGAKIYVDYLNLKTYSALYGAVEKGDEEIVKILVEEGNANVELRNKDHLWTPLHMAAHSGYFNIVKYLVEEAGANVLATTGDGRDTAQTLAEKNGHHNVAQYLIFVNQ